MFVAMSLYGRYTKQDLNSVGRYLMMAIFGLIIALCGCYFGVNCGRNADSVGTATTNAVVYAIVWMIVMTGILTAVCEGLGV